MFLLIVFLWFQESCVKLFKKLSAVNREMVWLKLISMWSPIQRLNPPIDGLQIVKVIILICTSL